MAIGIAQVLGIRFGENFKRPYLSRSIKEFWQRWHISLNSWFVDYVYIPLGGSRKGKFRYFLNIFIVFFLSGLWHGAAMHFIYWGCLNALYQIVGNLTAKFRGKIYKVLKLDPESAVAVAWKRICVFYLIALSWIFFTIPDTVMSLQMIKGILLPPVKYLFDGWIFGYFETTFAALSLLATIGIFAWVQTKREKGSFTQLLSEQAPIVRYGLYVAVAVLLLFGFFGTFTGAGSGGFVYGNF
jgi:D-alanyl-lipoteichoic acid acyltransferase DltB (MBOAT superfamily)